MPESARASWIELHDTLEQSYAPSSADLQRLNVLALDTHPEIVKKVEDCIAHFDNLNREAISEDKAIFNIIVTDQL